MQIYHAMAAKKCVPPCNDTGHASFAATSSVAFADSQRRRITLQNAFSAALQKQRKTADSYETNVANADDTTPADSSESNMPNEEEMQSIFIYTCTRNGKYRKKRFVNKFVSIRRLQLTLKKQPHGRWPITTRLFYHLSKQTCGWQCHWWGKPCGFPSQSVGQ